MNNQKCPTCGSKNPKLHPTMQYEGEVQICSDSWHNQRKEITLSLPDTEEMRTLLRTLAMRCIDDLPSMRIQQSLGIVSEKDTTKDIDANMAFDYAVYRILFHVEDKTLADKSPVNESPVDNRNEKENIRT